jgi:hypothetical protein
MLLLLWRSRPTRAHEFLFAGRRSPVNFPAVDGKTKNPLCVLVEDVGGSNVKLQNSSDRRTAKFKSGKTMTASEMVE